LEQDLVKLPGAPAWKELEGIELVAVCNRNKKRAEEIAENLGVPKVY